MHQPSATADGLAGSGGQPAIELLLLSQLIGSIQGVSVRATHLVCKALSLYGRTAIERSGALEAAPFPGLPTGPWPEGLPALRRRGLSLPEVRGALARRRFEQGPSACLDAGLVAELIPPVLWDVVAQLIADGPHAFAARSERALMGFALTTVRANKRRAAGPPSLNAIRGLRHAFRRLGQAAVDLDRAELGHPELAAWTALPRLNTPQLPVGPRREVLAPRPELVRAIWRRLHDDVHDALGAAEGDDLVAAVDRLSRARLINGGIFYRFRSLLALTLYVVLGGRVGAIRRLDRSDFVANRVGPPPDHRRGHALMLRPGKSQHEELIRPKPIPNGLVILIRAWLRLLERHRRAMFNAPPSLDPRRPATAQMPADHPLLVGTLVSLSRWDASSILTLFSGAPPGAGKNGTPALVPRESGWRDDLPVEQRRFVGYTPHEFRHLAEQLAEEAGARWAQDHPSRGARPDPEPALYGSALLDHGPAGDAMRNLYGDRNAEHVYELLSGRAIDYMYRLLTTDDGARRRPDRGALEATAERLRLVEAELGRLHRRATELHRAADPALPARLVIRALPAEASDRAVLDAIAADQTRFAERQDLLLHRIDALRASIAEGHRLLYELTTLNDLRDQLKTELWALWSNPRRWEVIPDSAPAGAEIVDFTLEDILGGRGAAASADDPAPDRVRDWVLPSELSWIVGVDRATITRQLAGTHLPRRSEDRPWSADAVPVDDSLGRKYRRVWIEGLPQSYWRTAEMRRRLALVLGRWPDAQGWQRNGAPTERSLSPLRLPEPFATRRRQLARGARTPSAFLELGGSAGRSG
jgi:hypothetical protein